MDKWLKFVHFSSFPSSEEQLSVNGDRNVHYIHVLVAGLGEEETEYSLTII